MKKITSILFILLVLTVSAVADYRIQVYAEETSGLPGEQGAEYLIRVINNNDVVAGFSLWLHFNNPDLADFSLEFDTVGCLVQGWQVINTNSVFNQNKELLITGLANTLTAPYVEGFSPQNGSTPLIKLKINVANVDDSTSDRSSVVQINTSMLDRFTFSGPNGTLIGVGQRTVYDSTFFRCLTQVGPDCTQWAQVLSPPFDSVTVDTFEQAYLDTSQVFVQHGKFSVGLCGNTNAFDNEIDILDLLYLVDYMFADPPGPPPVSLQAADVDNSSVLDVNDLLYLVDYFFAIPNGPAPACQ